LVLVYVNHALLVHVETVSQWDVFEKKYFNPQVNPVRQVLLQNARISCATNFSAVHYILDKWQALDLMIARYSERAKTLNLFS